MTKNRRLAPSRSQASRNIEIARQMLRSIDYEKQYEKQEFSREPNSPNRPLKLYFLREGSYLHFSFEGFELFGHKLTISHNGSEIASALINHTGDASICLDQAWLPQSWLNDFRLTISPTPVG